MKCTTIVVLVLCALSLLCGAEVHRLEANAGSLVVNVNSATGSYTIEVDGATWFTSGPTAFHSSNTWYKSGDQLKLISSSTTSGTDVHLGPFTTVNLNWQGGSIPFTTSVTAYSKQELVLFTQHFPNGVQSPVVSNSSSTVVATFPTLPTSSAVPLFYYTYQGTFAYPHIGRWINPAFPGGVEGGSPVLFYNSNNLRSIVFSPYDNFMTGVQMLASDFPGYLSFGLNGKILNIPAGWTYSTILVGGQGIDSTMYAWGKVLLDGYGKRRATLDSDLLIKELGYWTDNGAYYYYLTEKGKDYATTMTDVGAYLKSINVPVKNFQFDSWWYYKGINNGVTVWEPMPSIFPNGMLPVTQKLGLPVGLHNRYFSPDSPYIKNYTFIVESFAALPLDQAMFEYIMGKAKGWGMIVYEQDWLVTTYMNLESTKNNVTNSRKWLMAMGNAATKLGLTIQYCMALPNHLLQSVEIQAVTQSRSSNDYQPSNNQWQIFHTSQLLWSLGIVPFKDDFWTSKNQSGCNPNYPPPGCIEYTPELETLVAALSAGPVGPADQIGKMNVDLIMRTTRASGDLLKADLPARPLDSTFYPQSNGSPKVIQVASSYTELLGFRWYYLLGADLSSTYTVTTQDFNLTGGRAKYINYFQFANDSSSVYDFTSSSPIKIPAASIVRSVEGAAPGPVDFSYYVIAPVLDSGWVFLGETNKFITVSKQRITSFFSTSGYFSVGLIGTPGEVVTLSLLNTSAQQKVQKITVTFTTSGSAVVMCTSGAAGTCKQSN